MGQHLDAMGKAAAYDVLVDGLEIAVGDGPTFKPAKGKVSPKNEYEELCLQVAVEAGSAKAPTKSALQAEGEED